MSPSLDPIDQSALKSLISDVFFISLSIAEIRILPSKRLQVAADIDFNLQVLR